MLPEQSIFSRRILVKSSVFGILGTALPNILFAEKRMFLNPDEQSQGMPHDRYPAIRLDVASEVVGVSHFNLERLREIVDPRPELANAIWDWGFGDWESAIGAASHVGRRDIVRYLVDKGAAPTIFTFAMLGAYETVKSMIEAYPGIQKNFGPHGISLLQHVKNGLETEGANASKSQKLIDYLKELGDADGKQYQPYAESEMQKYIGDYKFGEEKDQGFTVKLNMRKLLSLGKIGKSGGALYKKGENEFAYNGFPSVTISFKAEGDKVISLTVNEPGLVLTATKA